jgi:hypothetical protein
LMPDTNKTQNNKQKLINTIESWQQILAKTLGILNKSKQD